MKAPWQEDIPALERCSIRQGSRYQLMAMRVISLNVTPIYLSVCGDPLAELQDHRTLNNLDQLLNQVLFW